jgi:hypothetical protein
MRSLLSSPALLRACSTSASDLYVSRILLERIRGAGLPFASIGCRLSFDEGEEEEEEAAAQPMDAESA